MNKSAIKNFAIWARNKLIADITYKAGLLGISEKEIKSALPQSTQDVQFFDIGTKEPYSISGIEIKQREKLAETINNKAKQSSYAIAYKAIVEEVAYTWFNRLIAVRFMEVNDYLPSRIRVLSSESATKNEPDLVTTPFDTDLDFTPYEKDRIVQLTHDNQLDELFRMLFIKQCNALNAILPNLFEKTNDYTELLLNVSFTDKDGVVFHMVHDIKESDFRIRTEADEEAIKQGDLSEEDAPTGQVEIIGWLYQYYNTEPKDETFALLKKNVKITKERIPAATQLFTPDWIVRYMVENSLGRIFIEWSLKSGEWSEQERIEKEKAIAEKMGWKYYLPEAGQEPEVRKQLKSQLLTLYTDFHIEDVKVIDPCMGSGHILVYAFDVLMQIYGSYGYSQRDAAKSIVAYNIYGLDIDNRAYQLAYFAVMMKARQYNRRILNGETDCHVYSIQESNGINRSHLKYFGAGMGEMERNTAMLQMQGLLDTFIDAKEYGSILNVKNYNWELLYRFLGNADMSGQMTLDTIGIEDTMEQLRTIVEIGAVMAQKYDVVVTNPPYMGASGFDARISEYIKKNYLDSKSDLFSVFIEKGINLLRRNGLMSYITMQAWMFLASYNKLRYKVACQQVESLLQIGFNSFPELNSQVAHAVTFTVRKTGISEFIGKYFNLNTKKTTDDKDLVFQSRIAKSEYYLNTSKSFVDIPNYNFAFWLTANEKDIILKSRSLGEIIEIRQGLATGDNNRFLREWVEVNFESIGIDMLSSEEFLKCGKKYAPYNKSGDFRKWYGNISSIVNWENDGFEIKHFVDAHGKLRSRPQNVQYYFRKGVTWSLISTNTFAARLSAGGFVFDVGGSSGFPDEANIWYTLGLLCSRITYSFLKAFNPTINFQIGDIKNIPVVQSTDKKLTINDLVKENVSISKVDWDSFETSWDFITHPLLNYKSGAGYSEKWSSKISDAFACWKSNTDEQFNLLKSNEEELNRIFIDIYGLQNELTPEVADKDVTIRKADLARDIRSFVSYVVGCMFGRYGLDVDGLVYAGGQWDNGKYSSFIPDKDNILPITDEEYFDDDIVGLFVAFVRKTFGAETLEENLDFIGKALGNNGNTAREIIRNYFVKDFFKDHCKIYQKRPIYWLFDSGKADGFKALVYMHRYDKNTIGNLRIDYLHRMQRVYDSEIVRMQETIENSTNAREVTAAEKRKEKLTKQLKEIKEYDEKIAHLALARISIDLDDGVKVNYEKVQTSTDGKKLEVLAKI